MADSLLARLEEHAAGGFLSLHMPGHKENTALAPYLARLGAAYDITELPGFDDLHAPEDILADGMRRAAALWGSGRCLFQVNGSSGALLAAVRTAARRGDKILMARHCHKSIYHAAELCGLEPIYLYPEEDVSFGLTGSVSPDAVRRALEEHPDIRLIVYPSPTYDGVVSDTAAICAAAHERGVPVLVDEAHGAHFGLFPGFPESAVRQGADLVAASLHKMLPSLTQTALLHVSGNLISADEAARQSAIFQSSSPSYLLMASIDGCIRLLEERGAALFAAWQERLAEFSRLIAPLKHLRVPGFGAEAGRACPGVFGLDPARITICTRYSALDGVRLLQLLREEYRIELEMALPRYAVAMTGPGTDDEMPARLAGALLELDERFGPPAQEKRPVRAEASAPRRLMGMEEAAMSPAAEIPLEEAAGAVSAESVWAYPPGIPLFVPGEEITSAAARQVRELHQCGVNVIGTRGTPPATVYVLRERP